MKTIIKLILFVVVLGTTTLSSDAASKQWRGDPFNFRWSDPDNWEPTGVPENGDELSFEDGGIVAMVMVNDLTGLTVNKLAFNGGAWELRGNELGVQSSIGNSRDGLVEIKCAIRLEGTTAFSGFSGFDADSADVRVSGPINLNGRVLRLVAREDTTVDLAGPISGDGQVIVYVETANYFSRGTVKFSGTEANTFTGPVTLTSQNATRFSGVEGSVLVLDKQSGLAVPGALTVGINCEVKLNRPHQVFNSAAVSLEPGAKFLLQGNNQTVGSLSMSARLGEIWTIGRSTVDTDGGTLSVERDISASNLHPNLDFIPIIKGQLGLPPGSHVIHTSGNNDFALNIEARIIGEGGFTKRGNRGVILSGDSSFAGDSVIEEGLVHVRHANALGAPSGATILEGGELEVRDVAIGIETLWVNRRSARIPVLGALLNVLGVSSWAGPIELNTNLTVSGGTMTLSGQITGSGGLRLIFNDRVQLTGIAANTYTGDTLADAALLELNKPFGVAAFGGRLIVGAGGNGGPDEVRWLQDYQCVGADVTLYPGALINLNNHREDFGPVTFNSGAIVTGAAGELGLYGLLTVNPSVAEANISGRLGLPPGLHEFRVGEGSAFPDLRIDATVLGAGHLRKTGPGQMWLAAANTYNGLTTVAEGALSVLDPNGLGAAATGTTVQEGATLELNFVGTLPEPLALRGEGVSGQGALGVFGDVTLRNPLPSIYAPVDLTTDTIIGVAPNSFLVVDGFISGIGALRKRGPGTLRFGGNDHNTYVGDTYIDEGIFIMAKPTGTTAVPGALSIGTSAGLPAMAGNVASYQVIGNIFVNRGGLLNLNGQVENVDHLWLTEGGDVQTSTGILFLKAGGSIQVVPGAAGDLSMITGNLDLDAGDHVINVGASTSSGLASAVQLEISALITSSLGSINLQKQGPGILRLTANNTYTGLTVVNAGVLQLDGIQAGSSFQVQNGGELAGQGRAGSINFLASGNGSRAVAPGNAPGLGGGILRCGSFNSAGGGGVLRVDLLGATPGVGGYDRLHAISRFANVRLDGVTLDARLHFASAVDNQFIIILNDGIFSLADDTPKPVIGEFVGLPEGTNFYIGGEQFRITYFGGDGNDVVLTRVPTPLRPVLTIERVAPLFVRLLWPASFNDYTLQSATNPSLPNWTATLPSPVTVGTNNVVTNATSVGPRFYRLFKP